MNRYLKKTLIISASVLMLLSVGAATNTVSARRYHSRYARHLVKRHSRRGHRRSRRTKIKKSRSKRIAKKRNRRTSHKRWRRIKRYRTGYFDHYGTWHKYSRRAKLSRRNGRKSRKGKRSKYYMSRRSHRKGRRSQRKARRHHVSYAAKVGAARDENFQDVNNDRESVGVDPIQRSSVLDQIAQERSQQLVTNNSHYDDNGDLVAQDDLSDNGYDPDIWNGENIMSNSGYQLNGTRSGDQANRQWWTDEAGATPNQDGGHRMNIRNPDFQSIGIGATYVPSTDSWYMCQDFSDETPDQIDNGDSTGSQESGDQGQGQDDSGDGGATAVATAGGGNASADADGGAAAAAAGGSAVGGSATGGSATGGSVGGNVVTGGSAVGGAGGSASSVVGPTVGGGNGNDNSNGGASSSGGNGAASVNDDGVSVTSGGNGTFINGKKVNPSGTYNEPNGTKVTFNNGNMTVQGADGSESSSSL